VVGSFLVLGFDEMTWDAATEKSFEHALRAYLGSELPAYCRIRISKGDDAGAGVIVHYRVTATSGSEAQHILHQIVISDPRTLQQRLREELERESQFVPPGLQMETEDGPVVEELGQPTDDVGIGTTTTDSAGEDAGGLPSWATAILGAAAAFLSLFLWNNGRKCLEKSRARTRLDEHVKYLDELRRISNTMALQPLKDPTDSSFYDIHNNISSLAQAGGVDDAQSMSDEAKENAMEKQLTELKGLRSASKALLLGFFKAVAKTSKGKLRQVSSQAEVQRPGDFYATVDEKSDESILKKVTRPKVLEEHPRYEMQHIRDALRFKCIVNTVVDAFRFLALLVDEPQWEERGVHAVKVDLKKLLKPKAFGWRFIGCDLKMPNGLLVECYIVFAPMMAVDRANHLFFEKWRGTKTLSRDEQQKYEADAKESTKRYNRAFRETLKDTTQNQFKALYDAFPSANRDEAVEVFNRILQGDHLIHRTPYTTRSSLPPHVLPHPSYTARRSLYAPPPRHRCTTYRGACGRRSDALKPDAGFCIKSDRESRDWTARRSGSVSVKGQVQLPAPYASRLSCWVHGAPVDMTKTAAVPGCHVRRPNVTCEYLAPD
jgi:hypothetical protein